MNIEYVKVMNAYNYRGYCFKLKSVECCCDMIKFQICEDRINMTRYNPYEDVDYCLNLHYGTVGNHELYIPIKVCPFCGAPIKVSMVDVVEFNELCAIGMDIDIWQRWETLDRHWWHIGGTDKLTKFTKGKEYRVLDWKTLSTMNDVVLKENVRSENYIVFENEMYNDAYYENIINEITGKTFKADDDMICYINGIAVLPWICEEVVK